MTYVKQKSWKRYQKIINKFINNDAGKQPFMWLHKINQPSPFGEDSSPVYIPTLLEGLFHYNYIKTWANNRLRDTVSGELDTGDMVLYISADLLGKGGYLDKYGYWNFNWAEDRFIINGKVYQPGGDTQVAQANDTALLFFVVLQRMNPEEQDKILEAYSGPELRVVNSKGIWLLDSEGKIIKDLLHHPIQVEREDPIIIFNG